MANYVLVVDLGYLAEPEQYMALNGLMYELGFTVRGPETLRPAQFSMTSTLPLKGLRLMVEGWVEAELQPDVVVEAYEIKELLQFGPAPFPHHRRFH
jgi:hypothetical protein